MPHPGPCCNQGRGGTRGRQADQARCGPRGGREETDRGRRGPGEDATEGRDGGPGGGNRAGRGADTRGRPEAPGLPPCRDPRGLQGIRARSRLFCHTPHPLPAQAPSPWTVCAQNGQREPLTELPRATGQSTSLHPVNRSSLRFPPSRPEQPDRTPRSPPAPSPAPACAALRRAGSRGLSPMAGPGAAPRQSYTCSSSPPTKARAPGRSKVWPVQRRNCSSPWCRNISSPSTARAPVALARARNTVRRGL